MMPQKTPRRFAVAVLAAASVNVFHSTAIAQREATPLPHSRSAAQARVQRNKALVSATKEYGNARAKASKDYLVQLKAALRKARKATDVEEVQRITAEMALVQREIEIHAAKSIYLADLVPAGAVVGYGKLGLNGDLGHGGLRVRVNKQNASHSVSNHAENDGVVNVDYVMPPQFTRLSGAAALNDTSGKNLNLIFSIEGDGRLLWQSENIVKGQAFPFDIDVSGVHHLRLLITCKGSSGAAHTVWLEPLLSIR